MRRKDSATYKWKILNLDIEPTSHGQVGMNYTASPRAVCRDSFEGKVADFGFL
jgi:hypothetical protein